jgi:hypothetical protein
VPGQPPSGDPYANLKPYERHLMSELLRLQEYLDDIPDGPDGTPVWMPEEREFIADLERLRGRPLTEPEKRIAVAQARFDRVLAGVLRATGQLSEADLDLRRPIAIFGGLSMTCSTRRSLGRRRAPPHPAPADSQKRGGGPLR